MTYGSNPTDTITGVVIYPDDFSFADAGVGAMSFGLYPPVSIDIDAWEALEDAGCVFLPMCRRINYQDDGALLMEEHISGCSAHYQTATAETAQDRRNFYFSANDNGQRISPTDHGARYILEPVRLVQDYY